MHHALRTAHFLRLQCEQRVDDRQRAQTSYARHLPWPQDDQVPQDTWLRRRVPQHGGAAYELHPGPHLVHESSTAMPSSGVM